jgi:hypothetical protein
VRECVRTGCFLLVLRQQMQSICGMTPIGTRDKPLVRLGVFVTQNSIRPFYNHNKNQALPGFFYVPDRTLTCNLTIKSQAICEAYQTSFPIDSILLLISSRLS